MGTAVSPVIEIPRPAPMLGGLPAALPFPGSCSPIAKASPPWGPTSSDTGAIVSLSPGATAQITLYRPARNLS
jgi:hypothetical protein